LTGNVNADEDAIYTLEYKLSSDENCDWFQILPTINTNGKLQIPPGSNYFEGIYDMRLNITNVGTTTSQIVLQYVLF